MFEEVAKYSIERKLNEVELLTKQIDEIYLERNIQEERMIFDSNDESLKKSISSDSESENESENHNGKELKLKNERQIEKFFFLNDDDDDVLLVDLNEEIAKNTAISIAPGENKKPVPWLNYPDIHELTFPKIYGGQKFNLNKVSYTNRVKSELRRADRRSCVPDHVLYMAKEKQERQCFENINVCLRKLKGTDMNAGKLLEGGVIDDLVLHDAGYRVLSNIRSSPAYWEKRKKEVMALLRQLGRPTFFITLTANEKRSPELLQTLYKCHYNKDITLEEAIGLRKRN